jgi:hypothetical protein
VEEIVRALEASTSKRMSAHMTHKAVAHPIIPTLLMGSIQQILKLHRVMDAQVGVGCDEGNFILRNQFAEAGFAGTRRDRIIGSDAFSEKGHTIVSMYLWAALKTHRVLQGYIELDFIAHPEVSSVVVEHLIKTRVPVTIYQAFKYEMVGINTSVKAKTTKVEKWSPRCHARLETL